MSQIKTRWPFLSSIRRPGSVETLVRSKAKDQSYSVIVDEFDSTYWSGLDLSIYFNEIYLDEIVNIQYQVSENVVPLYSYGDYTIRHTARGSRIIQGAFSINFKRAYYLIHLLDLLKQGPRPVKEQKINILYTPQTVEEVLSIARNGGKEIDFSILNDLQQEYEAKFWDTVDPDIEERFKRTNTPLYQSANGGFTIYLKYGEGVYDETNDQGETIVKKDIGTIEALTGVEITSAAKTIDDSGRNVLESYTFIAKDLLSA